MPSVPIPDCNRFPKSHFKENFRAKPQNCCHHPLRPASGVLPRQPRQCRRPPVETAGQVGSAPRAFGSRLRSRERPGPWSRWAPRETHACVCGRPAAAAPATAPAEAPGLPPPPGSDASPPTAGLSSGPEPTPVPAAHPSGYSPRGRTAIAAMPAGATTTGPAWRGRGPGSGPRRPVLGAARTEGWTGTPRRQRGTDRGPVDAELTGRRQHPHSQPYKCLVPRLLPVGAG